MSMIWSSRDRNRSCSPVSRRSRGRIEPSVPLRSTMTKCVIARISKADITRVIHEEPAFAELFISHLLARNSRVEEDLVDQLFNSSEKRLARLPPEPTPSATLKPLPSPVTGLPRLPEPPFRRAAPTTPADQAGAAASAVMNPLGARRKTPKLELPARRQARPRIFLVAVLAYCRGFFRADNLLGSR